MIDVFDTLSFDHYILAHEEMKIVDIVRKIADCIGAKYEIIEKEEGITKKTCSNERLLNTFDSLTFEDFDSELNNTIKWFINNYDSVRK